MVAAGFSLRLHRRDARATKFSMTFHGPGCTLRPSLESKKGDPAAALYMVSY